MKEIIHSSKVLTCNHSELQVELIGFFVNYKKQRSFNINDYGPIASQVINFIAENRCKKEEMRDSYKLFILNKIEVAFKSSLKVQTIKLEEDEAENLLDIPIEEFEDAVTDHEFLKLVGWNE
jgi:hypothetical protein